MFGSICVGIVVSRGIQQRDAFAGYDRRVWCATVACDRIWCLFAMGQSQVPVAKDGVLCIVPRHSYKSPSYCKHTGTRHARHVRVTASFRHQTAASSWARATGECQTSTPVTHDSSLQADSKAV